VPDCIQEQYTADALGLSPLEVRRLSYERRQVYLGYVEGKRLGEWATQYHEAKAQERKQRR